jgi:hypothetical protein
MCNHELWLPWQSLIVVTVQSLIVVTVVITNCGYRAVTNCYREVTNCGYCGNHTTVTTIRD